MNLIIKDFIFRCDECLMKVHPECEDFDCSVCREVAAVVDHGGDLMTDQSDQPWAEALHTGQLLRLVEASQDEDPPVGGDSAAAGPGTREVTDQGPAILLGVVPLDGSLVVSPLEASHHVDGAVVEDRGEV